MVYISLDKWEVTYFDSFYRGIWQDDVRMREFCEQAICDVRTQVVIMPHREDATLVLGGPYTRRTWVLWALWRLKSEYIDGASRRLFLALCSILTDSINPHFTVISRKG